MTRHLLEVVGLCLLAVLLALVGLLALPFVELERAFGPALALSATAFVGASLALSRLEGPGVAERMGISVRQLNGSLTFALLVLTGSVATCLFVHAVAAAAVGSAALRGWVPGGALGVWAIIGEEFYFRGLVQRRAIVGLGTVRGIGMTALGFTFVHFMFPLYGAHLLPLALWLGVVTWASGSVWWSVMGHVIHNMLSGREVVLATGGALWVHLLGSMLVLPVVMWALVRQQRAHGGRAAATGTYTAEARNDAADASPGS